MREYLSVDREANAVRLRRETFSGAFLLVEGSSDKIFYERLVDKAVLLKDGMPIGYLRWVSQLDGLNLTFDGIKFSSFINEQTLEIDQIKLIQEVKNKSQAFALDNEDLQQRLKSQQSSNHDPWQVCCGHDLVEILSLSLRKAIGSAKTSDVEPTTLERSLRLAYEVTYFRKTQIYLSIRLWETNNQTLKVFRNDL